MAVDWQALAQQLGVRNAQTDAAIAAARAQPAIAPEQLDAIVQRMRDAGLDESTIKAGLQRRGLPYTAPQGIPGIFARGLYQGLVPGSARALSGIAEMISPPTPEGQPTSPVTKYLPQVADYLEGLVAQPEGPATLGAAWQGGDMARYLARVGGAGIGSTAPSLAAAIAGGLPAMLVSSYAQNAGSHYNEMREAGVAPERAAEVAGITGVPVALLDALGLSRVPGIGRYIVEGGEQIAGGAMRRAAVGAGRGMLAEIPTEMAQQAIQEAATAHAITPPGTDSGTAARAILDRFTKGGGLERVGEAGLGAALVGGGIGAIGAIGGAAQGRARPVAAPQPEAPPPETTAPEAAGIAGLMPTPPEPQAATATEPRTQAQAIEEELDPERRAALVEQRRRSILDSFAEGGVAAMGAPEVAPAPPVSRADQIARAILDLYGREALTPTEPQAAYGIAGLAMPGARPDVASVTGYGRATPSPIPPEIGAEPERAPPVAAPSPPAARPEEQAPPPEAALPLSVTPPVAPAKAAPKPKPPGTMAGLEGVRWMGKTVEPEAAPPAPLATVEGTEEPDVAGLLDEEQALMRTLPANIGKAKAEGKLSRKQLASLDRISQIEAQIPWNDPRRAAYMKAGREKWQAERAQQVKKFSAEAKQRLDESGFKVGDKVSTFMPSMLGGAFGGQTMRGTVRQSPTTGKVYVLGTDRQHYDLYRNKWRKTEGEAKERVSPAPTTSSPQELRNKPPLERTDAENKALLAYLEKQKFKGASGEREIELLRGRIASDPSKWKIGDGVGYRVDRQINRGFQVADIDPVRKTALVRQVADTGLTITGGDRDRIPPTEVHLSDLVRDRKYDAPEKSAVPAALVPVAPSPESKPAPPIGPAPKRPKLATRDWRGRPKSLLAYLKSQGGIRDEGGELKSRDLNISRPGLVRKKGMSLNDAVVSATEAGYFQTDERRGVVADEDDLLRAIDDEVAGKKLYALQDQEEARQLAEKAGSDADRHAAARAVDEAADDFGLDLSQAESDRAVEMVLRGDSARDAQEAEDVDDDAFDIPFEAVGERTAGPPRQPEVAVGREPEGDREGAAQRPEAAARVEPGAEGLPQTILPGAERTAKQAMAAREAQGPRRGQKAPGGMFEEPEPEQEGLKFQRPKLDMSQAARKARAEAMGFDTGKVWYHGTQASKFGFEVGEEAPPGTHALEKLTPRLGGLKMMDGMGVHFGTQQAAQERLEKNVGAKFGTRDVSGLLSGSYVIPMYVKMIKPFAKKDGQPFTEGELQSRLSAMAVKLGFKPSDTRAYSARYGGINRDAQRAVKKELQRQGYDGIYYINSHEDRGSISGIVFDGSQLRSIHAAFDPAHPERPELLAQEPRARREPERSPALERLKRAFEPRYDILTPASPELAEAREQARTAIERVLNRVVGRKIKTEVYDRLLVTPGDFPVLGAYGRGLLQVALIDDRGNLRSDDDLLGTARHEAIHVLRGAGAISDADWNALLKETGRWREQFDIDARYQGGSEELLNEEAIAEAYADWAAGKLKARGPVAHAFEVMRRIFRQIANAVRRALKLDPKATWEDVLRRIEAGEMAGGRPTMGAATRYAIGGWHGSGKDFAAFADEFIGSGEGAQVYGWGHYFSSLKEVAQHYKKQEEAKRPLAGYAHKLWEEWYAASSALKDAQSKYDDGIYGNYSRRKMESLAEQVEQAAAQEAAASAALDAVAPRGKLYRVTLAPNEEDLLDWDKPLSEQSEKIQDAILLTSYGRQGILKQDAQGRWVPDPESTPAKVKENFAKEWTGEKLYQLLTRESGSPRAASMALLEAGIPGIKYLVGSQRRAGGEGDRNYVMFDPSMVTIEEKFQRPRTGYHATNASFSQYDFARLGEVTAANQTDDDPNGWAMRLAKLGAWFSDKNLSKQTGSEFVKKAELSGSVRKFGSLNELADFISEAGSPQAARQAILDGGDSVIEVADEEFGGTSFVALTPETIRFIGEAAGGTDLRFQRPRFVADRPGSVEHIRNAVTTAWSDPRAWWRRHLGEIARQSILRYNVVKKAEGRLIDQMRAQGRRPKVAEPGERLLRGDVGSFKIVEMASQDGGRFEMLAKDGPPVWDPKTGEVKPDTTIGGLEQGFKFNGTADYHKGIGYIYANRAQRIARERAAAEAQMPAVEAALAAAKARHRKRNQTATELRQAARDIEALEQKLQRLRDTPAERLMTPQEIRDALTNVTPEEKQRYDAMIDFYQRFNNRLLQFDVDTGAVQQEHKDLYVSKMDYVPFYRIAEATGELLGPSDMRRGLSNPDPRIRRLMGGTEKLGDLMDNIARNARTLMTAGLRNVAVTRTKKIVDALGESTDLGPNDSKEGAVSYFDKGVKRYFMPDDPALAEALIGLRPVQLDGWMHFAQKLTRIYRGGVTLMPPFMIANFLRGDVAAWVQTGKGFKWGYNSLQGLRNAWQRSDSIKEMKAISGTGGYRFGPEAPTLTGASLRRATGAEDASLWQKVQKALDWLERVGEASELAARDVVYRQLLSEGKPKAEAAYQAMNLINYSRHGQSRALMNYIAMIPFLNARIQGLYRMAETPGLNGAARRRLLAGIAMRGSLLSMATLALWAWNMSDDETRKKWEALPMEEKLLYWHLWAGDTHIRIPKPFEFGTLFASLPEAILDALAPGNGGHDLASFAVQSILNTLGFNPIPQPILPLAETYFNYDIFRQRPIENLAMQRLAPELRAGPSTSATARAVSEATGAPMGLSPVRVEHLLEGYLGAMGGMALATSDALLGAMGGLPEKPTGAFGSVPVASKVLEILGSRFVKSEPSPYTRWVDDLYTLKEEADQIANSTRNRLLAGDIEGARAQMAKDPKLMAMRPVLDQTADKLADIARAINMVRADKSLSGNEMAEKLKPLYRMRNDLARNVVKMTEKVTAD